MTKKIIFILTLFVSFHTYGQGELDAFRFSRNDLQGTARVQAMGGAFGALGGDVGAITINPAGIGIYRSSELVATLGMSNVEISTNSSKDKDSKKKFNLENLSYVGYFPLTGNGPKTVNFGFTYNRLKSFDQQYTSNNANRATSLTDYMGRLSDGYTTNELGGGNAFSSGAPWLGVLGFSGSLINHIDGNIYESILEGGEMVDSKLNVKEKGYIDAYDFTIGTSIQDKFYLGLAFTLTNIDYRATYYYDEYFENRGQFFLDNHLETDGSGYQLKLGAIYRPSDAIRLGISYHSPTWYSLTDYYYGKVIPAGIDGTKEVGTPNDAYTNYKIQTPYSFTFSLATILDSRASISADYEIKDYASMKIEDNYGSDRNYLNDNKFINQDFKLTSTLRLGLEYKFTPQIAGRIGYAWMQSPYDTKFKNGEIEVVTAGTIPHYTLLEDSHHVTFGLGYRFTSQFYMDFAFVYKMQKENLYYFSGIPEIETQNGEIIPALISEKVKLKNNTYRGLLTLGYKF